MAHELFLVERYLPAPDGATLVELQARLQAAAAAMRREGQDVAWLQSVVVPAEDTCLCLFRAAHEALVTEANERAHADYERISPALAAGEL